MKDGCRVSARRYISRTLLHFVEFSCASLGNVGDERRIIDSSRSLTADPITENCRHIGIGREVPYTPFTILYFVELRRGGAIHWTLHESIDHLFVNPSTVCSFCTRAGARRLQVSTGGGTNMQESRYPALTLTVRASILLLGACQSASNASNASRDDEPASRTVEIPAVQAVEPEVIPASAGKCTVRCCKGPDAHEFIDTIVASSEGLCRDWAQGKCSNRGHVNVIRWHGVPIYERPGGC